MFNGTFPAMQRPEIRFPLSAILEAVKRDVLKALNYLVVNCQIGPSVELFQSFAVIFQ
jgi:hypothetical protein